MAVLGTDRIGVSYDARFACLSSQKIIGSSSSFCSADTASVQSLVMLSKVAVNMLHIVCLSAIS